MKKAFIVQSTKLQKVHAATNSVKPVGKHSPIEISKIPRKKRPMRHNAPHFGIPVSKDFSTKKTPKIQRKKRPIKHTASHNGITMKKSPKIHQKKIPIKQSASNFGSPVSNQSPTKKTPQIQKKQTKKQSVTTLGTPVVRSYPIKKPSGLKWDKTQRRQIPSHKNSSMKKYTKIQRKKRPIKLTATHLGFPVVKNSSLKKIPKGQRKKMPLRKTVTHLGTPVVPHMQIYGQSAVVEHYSNYHDREMGV